MTSNTHPIWVHDLAGTQVAAIGVDLLELWHDERQDQTERLGFAIPANHPKAGHVTEDVEIRYRDRMFRIDEVEDERDGTTTIRRATGEALWVELGDSDIPGTTIVDDTALNGLTQILDGSRWTVGSRTVPGGDTYTIEETDGSRLALLRTWSKVTGLHLTWDTVNRRVDLVTTRGRDLGLAYRYRRNVRSHLRRRRAPSATVLLPYGADDLTIAGVNAGNPELADYTYYTDRGLTLEQAKTLRTRRRVWVDRSFVRETNLYDAAVEQLSKLSAENITYEIDVIDDTDLIGASSDPVASDRVRVADDEFDVDVRVTIVRVYRDLLDSTNNVVELSTNDTPIDAADSTGGRPSSSAAWEQFDGPIGAALEVRNDGDYIAASIPLRFRANSRAHIGYNVTATGVGAGTLIVSVVDTNSDPEDVYRIGRYPYTDGAEVHAAGTFAIPDIAGASAFRLRVTTEADGGPSGSAGVNISADPTDPAAASFWVMAQTAVEETPTTPTSTTYEFTGAVQSFTVPDNVEEITVTAEGGQGGGASGGNGGRVTATFPVVPGTDYDVYVGGQGGTISSTFPNGGQGGQRNSSHGSAGGGATYLVPAGGTITGSIIVAAGGGGQSSNGYSGGVGGFISGGNGTGPAYNAPNYGEGATQSAPGAQVLPGDVPSQGWGAARTGNTAANHNGGGGGGGWHGGGAGNGGGGGAYVVAAGGGGGSGYVHTSGDDIEAFDGAVTGAGQLVVSWAAALPNL